MLPQLRGVVAGSIAPSMIDLIALDGVLAKRLSGDPGFTLAGPWSNGEDLLPYLAPVSQAMLALYGTASPVRPWIGYLARAEEDGAVVGTCAFKAPPSAGVVEIAYYTFPPYEGRGFAGAMADALIALARESDAVVDVLAHTLRREGASTRILRRRGFDFEGEIDDPEDGPIWRWRLTL